MAFCDDPAHAWIRDTWAGHADGPALPGDVARTRTATPLMGDEHRAADHGAGAGALAGRATLASCSTAPRCRCSPACSASSGTATCSGLGTALLRGARRAADLARADRAGHGAGRGRLRQGHRPAAGDGRDLVGRPGRAEHGHRRRAGPRQPAAGAAAARRHVRRPRARPGAAAGRALRRRHRQRQRRVPCRCRATSTGSPGPSSCWPRCRRWLGCSPIRPTAGRWCSPCRRTCRPRSSTSRRRCSSRGCTGCRGPRRTRSALAEAAELLRGARRPLIVAGGGVRYSGAGAALLALAEAHGVPVAETAAGRTVRARSAPAATPARSAPSAPPSANALAADADVVLAVGTRLQDFTTSSWSVFAPGRAARHRSTPPASTRSSTPRTPWSATPARRSPNSPPRWPVGAPTRRGPQRAAAERAALGRAHRRAARRRAPDGALTYAQVVGVVNDASGPQDYVLGSSGGIPGELQRRLAHRCRRRPARRWTWSTASPAWATRSPGRGARRWRAPAPTRTGWSPRCSATART